MTAYQTIPPVPVDAEVVVVETTAAEVVDIGVVTVVVAGGRSGCSRGRGVAGV